MSGIRMNPQPIIARRSVDGRVCSACPSPQTIARSGRTSSCRAHKTRYTKQSSMIWSFEVVSRILINVYTFSLNKRIDPWAKNTTINLVGCLAGIVGLRNATMCQNSHALYIASQSHQVHDISWAQRQLQTSCRMMIQIHVHKIKANFWQSVMEARVKPKARVGAKQS
jgi:hypothetical protein